MTANENNYKHQASVNDDNFFDPDDFLGRGVKSNKPDWHKENSNSALKHKRRDDTL